MRRAAILCLLALAATAAAQSPRQARARVEVAFQEKYQQGLRWMRQQQWQRADTAFAQALTFRDSPDARRMSRKCRFNLHLERGEAALTAGRYPNAAEHYQQALDLDSGSAAATEGLRSAHYRIAYREGTLAGERHSYDEARRAFERCLEIRSADPAARGQLQAIDREVGAGKEYQAAWERIGRCLGAGDLGCLDGEIPRLKGAVAGIAGQPAQPSPDAPLLPALLLYSQGNRPGAEIAARTCGAASAPLFQDLLRRRARYEWAKRWSGWAGGVYGLTLLLSVYFGVRQIRTRQMRAGLVGE